MNKLSMSTVWAGDKYKNGQQLVEGYLALGFNRLELNYSITQKMFNEIIPYVEEGVIEVTSVHHPLPKQEDEEYGPASIMLGFLDEDKRQKAIELTKTSIDCAAKVGAKVLVVHLSEVPTDETTCYDDILKEYYRTGKRNSIEYRNIFQKMLDHRSVSEKHIEKTIESLKELCRYIKEKEYDLCIGMENRAMSHQIPDFYEAEYILEQLEGLPVYFWYDIGHGIMMENLGLFQNKASLEKIIDKTIGIHIHDAKGVSDHYAPYELGSYLDEFIPLINKIPVKVLEVGPFIEKEAIIEGAKRLSSALD